MTPDVKRPDGSFPHPGDRGGILLVTPVRDEAGHLAEVIRHVARQTVKPAKWVLVDDHSIDGSTGICREAARGHPWIDLLVLGGRRVARRLDRHVYEVQKAGFDFGIDRCAREGIPYRYLGLLDADMFPCVDYYDRLVKILEKDPGMGIVSGGVYSRERSDRLVWEESPPVWPVGGARVMRRECFEEIGGVAPVNSGDAVGAIRAMGRGYRVRQFREIVVVQARRTSSATGLRRGYFQKGIDDYVLGYSPFYASAKGLSRSLRQSLPLGACYFAGYCSAPFLGRVRIDDPVVRGFCRWRLLRRMLGTDPALVTSRQGMPGESSFLIQARPERVEGEEA